tara:strand:+ start:2244 stop:2873 length:630 start_codon:yes stop_codon:yes gene_type:complete
MYNIKEIYFTLQGEGFYTGRPAIFIRFSGCNLWNGLEADRNKAICNWCDTDFFGINGPNGGKHSAPNIKKIIIQLWPSKQPEKPYVVFTGGEPLLQLDDKLISAVHNIGFEIGIETNGTITPPKGIDWVCVSPKANTNLVVKAGNELKFVYPQCGLNPKKHEKLDFDHFFIQPMDGSNQNENIEKSKKFVAKNPKWKISLQTHKLLGMP